MTGLKKLIMATRPKIIVGFNPITAGLAGWWKLDDATGTTAHDSSGNSNDGVLVNSAFFTTNVKPCVHLGGFKELVQIPATFNSLITNNISVSFWMYSNGSTFTSDTGFVACAYKADAVRYAVLGYFDGGSPVRAYTGFFNGAWILTTPNNDCQFGQWIHMVSTYDGNTIKLYINGSLDSSLSYTSTIPSTNNAWYIGARWDYDYDVFGSSCVNGYMSDVRIYNRALSSTEVSQIYNLQG